MSYISKLKGLTENEAKFIFLKLFKAVFYLHNDLKVAHRNLSTENIFIDKDNNPKIIGLGSAELIPSVSNENNINLGNNQTQANGNNQNQANGYNQNQANGNNVLHSVNETNSYTPKSYTFPLLTTILPKNVR